MESTQQPSNSEPPRLLQLEESRKHAAQARRRAAETDEDRQKRLAARRASYAKRRAAETDLQKRLTATRTDLAKQCAADTGEHLEESTQLPSYSGPPRLLQPEEPRKHTAQARRRAAETHEDREKRLAARREFDTTSRAAETSEQRQKRLNAQKDAKARWRAAGTAEDRRQRLDREKIRRARRSCGPPVAMNNALHTNTDVVEAAIHNDMLLIN